MSLSEATFMYDEVISFSLGHSDFVGDTPDPPPRDYKITFTDDFNTIFASCPLPYVKDQVDRKEVEGDTGQLIWGWNDTASPTYQQGILVHTEAPNKLTFYQKRDPPQGAQNITLKFYPRWDTSNSWGELHPGQYNTENANEAKKFNAAYIVLDKFQSYPVPDEQDKTIFDITVGEVTITLSVVGNPNKDENTEENNHDYIHVQFKDGQGNVLHQHQTLPSDSPTLHLYLDFHPDENKVRMSVHRNMDGSEEMDTYAKCLQKEWTTRYKNTWADKNCLDDYNVSRMFSEHMRARLDDLFLGSKQADEGDDVEGKTPLKLAKVKNFLTPNGTGFSNDLDFGTKVGTQQHMLTIFDRAINYGRYKDTFDDESGDFYRRILDLNPNDKFGFTVRLQEEEYNNTITILLLFQQVKDNAQE